MSQVTVEKVESGKIDKKSESPRHFSKAVPFILGHVFFERFCSGGILAILAIFVNQKLDFDSDVSTAIFHANEFILYFCTIVGAIIADSWLGLFKTISCLTFLSFVGTGLVAVATIDVLELPMKVLSIIGLAAFVVASGGIKTNQNVFGGNQFKLPEQESQLNKYFTYQYFVLKCGLLGGQMTIPILRNDVKCFGADNCYPLAFGVPSTLMLIALFVILCGNFFYVQVPPNENMFVKVCSCITTALKTRFKTRKTYPRKHWLDYAEDGCGEKLVAETKMVLNVLTLFLPLPLFWAMYSQCNSRWVFQATKMDGNLGFYTIKPDQMVMLPTIFIISLLPIFDFAVYPLLSKIGIKTALQKVTCGFVCCMISFVTAAVIEWKINQDYIPMLWLFPQYFFIALSEVFIWVPIVNFAYTQAPERMKSVMTSFVYVTVAGGSLIVMIVSGSKLVESQMNEFLMYSGVMVFNIIFFIILIRNYTFVDKK